MGFILFELLVVMALILIIYVMPCLPSARPHQTQMELVCALNLRNVQNDSYILRSEPASARRLWH